MQGLGQYIGTLGQLSTDSNLCCPTASVLYKLQELFPDIRYVTGIKFLFSLFTLVYYNSGNTIVFHGRNSSEVVSIPTVQGIVVAFLSSSFNCL